MSHGVFRAMLSGVCTKGDGGVVDVEGHACAYMFPCEFANEAFRGQLVDAMSSDAGQSFFVVEKRDDHLHVVSYIRQRVWDDAMKSLSSGDLAPTRETVEAALQADDRIVEDDEDNQDANV